MKKGIILIILSLLAVILILLSGIFIYIKENDATVINRELAFEYGDEIKVEAKDVIDAKENVLNTFTIDVSDIKEIGTYNKKITYAGVFGNVEDEITIEVKDTTKPSFTNSKEEFTIENGDKDYDFKSAFACDDLNGCEIEIDTSKVDFESEGTYEAIAKAKDKYQNEEVLNFKINVKKVEAVGPQGAKPKYVNGILIVNKKYPIPAYFRNGEDPTAGNQARALIREMQSLGFDISSGYSGFRSHDYQRNLYNRYVANDGKANADTYSARPGHSEHETGLAYDICHSSGALATKEAEVTWLAKNAHRYGFIVRYLKGKEHITGYMAEPWHIRYVGDVAEDIYNSGLTLEEYLGVEGGDYNY